LLQILTVHSNLLAICESAGTTTPSTVHLVSLNPRSIVASFPHPSKRTVISAAFSHNGKLLALQGAAPNNTFALVRTETGQILSTRDLMSPGLRHISFSPHDDSLICVSGSNYLRLLKREHHDLEELTLVDAEYEAGATCFSEHVRM
jgi:hypothetical protein